MSNSTSQMPPRRWSGREGWITEVDERLVFLCVARKSGDSKIREVVAP